MVICSCNVVTTENIRAVLTYVTDPNVRQVLNMLGWESDCAICANNLVTEIRKVMKEFEHGDELQGC
jgi:bacterioferritin-associated ferredoxin